MKSGRSISANVTETSHNDNQLNSPGLHSNRFLQSHSKPKISHALTNTSRSDEHLPLSLAERSHSEPVLPMHTDKRSFSTPAHNLVTLKKIGPPQNSDPANPPEPRSHTERQISLVVPIVEPIELQVETVLPRNQLRRHNLAAQESSHPGMCFIEMENNSNPMLMMDIYFPTSSPDDDDDDDDDNHFLLESVDVKLEEQGSIPEFDDFPITVINVTPIVPSEKDRDFPYKLFREERHRWIYSVEIKRVDLVPEDVRYQTPSIFKHGYYPVNFDLPPPTSISNASWALQHQRSGISNFDEAYENMENENPSGETAISRGDGQQRPLPYRTHHRTQVKSGLPVRKLARSEPVYLLSVTISGRVISGNSNLADQSTDMVSGIWTSLLGSDELSKSTSLQLYKTQGSSTKNYLELDASLPTSTHSKKQYPQKISDTRVDGIILGGGGFDEELKHSKHRFPQGLVAGSTRHTASNLVTALNEFSNFQSCYNMRMSKLGEDGNQKNHWLSPFDQLAGNHHLDQRQHRSKLKLTQPHDFFASPLASPNSPSPSNPNPNLGRQHVSSNPRYFVDSPDSSLNQNHGGLISTLEFSDRSSQTNKVEIQRDQSERRLSSEGRYNLDKRKDARNRNSTAGPKGEGLMMVEVKLCHSHNVDQVDENVKIKATHRFKLYEPFSIEVLVFHCSSDSNQRSSLEDGFQLGPFKVKIITDLVGLPPPLMRRYIDQFETLSVEGNQFSKLSPPSPPPHHQPDSVDNSVGVISLNESIQIGPLAIGECETGKMDLIGIKTGFFQLKAIQIIPLLPNSSVQPSDHPIDFFLLDPIVVFIE